MSYDRLAVELRANLLSPRETTPNKERTGNEQSAPLAPSNWNSWEEIAGKHNRAVLGKLIKQYGVDAVAEAVTIVATKQPADPVGYIHGILRNSQSRNDHLLDMCE